jgi:hypothetical protein
MSEPTKCDACDHLPPELVGDCLNAGCWVEQQLESRRENIALLKGGEPMSDDGAATPLRVFSARHIADDYTGFRMADRDFYTVDDVRDLHSAHAQAIAQLRRERDELRRAIHSTADESWQHSAYVALAEAHRVDSDTVDEWEDSDEPRKTRAEAQVAQLRKEIDTQMRWRDGWKERAKAAEAHVAQLTARLRELRELWIQGIVYPSDAMARAFQYRNEDDGRILCVDCDQPIHDPHATGCRVGRFTQLIVGATDGLPSPPVP